MGEERWVARKHKNTHQQVHELVGRKMKLKVQQECGGKVGRMKTNLSSVAGKSRVKLSYLPCLTLLDFLPLAPVPSLMIGEYYPKGTP